jgi:hypothetical protein
MARVSDGSSNLIDLYLGQEEFKFSAFNAEGELPFDDVEGIWGYAYISYSKSAGEVSVIVKLEDE